MKKKKKREQTKCESKRQPRVQTNRRTRLYGCHTLHACICRKASHCIFARRRCVFVCFLWCVLSFFPSTSTFLSFFIFSFFSSNSNKRSHRTCKTPPHTLMYMQRQPFTLRNRQYGLRVLQNNFVIKEENNSIKDT